jgi:hypothetical protein
MLFVKVSHLKSLLTPSGAVIEAGHACDRARTMTGLSEGLREFEELGKSYSTPVGVLANAPDRLRSVKVGTVASGLAFALGGPRFYQFFTVLYPCAPSS